MEQLKYKVLEAFEAQFGAGAILFGSPGRINLIGEHTDYNGGFVFPGAVDKGIVAAIRPSENRTVNITALDLNESCTFSLDDEKPAPSWTHYIYGVCQEVIKRGGNISGFDAVFAGNVPLGAGMSSSAALESTFAFALNDLYNCGFEQFELARIGQATEHNYCGVKCGIMDQFASVHGRKGCLMRLDCRSGEFVYYPFKAEGYRLFLLDTKVKHALVGSPYNDRRASCERVAQAMGRELLRGADMADLEAIRPTLTDEDYRRARYIIGEERRVMQVCEALERGDMEEVGRRMFETHHGLSKDFEVSCVELDYLADVAEEYGVTGARMMGGGFGGCTINLIREELFEGFVEEASRRFEQQFGHAPAHYEIVISDGARRM
ncbi:MAG: galactokinase [Alistipes sp.]|nr:galactokinase [Alistipes sp.]